MIAHLRGKLIAKSPNQVIVEAGGVGYELNITIPTFSGMPALDSSSRRDRSCWTRSWPRAVPTTWTRRRTMPRSSTSSLDQVRAEQLARLRERLPEVLRGNRFWSERLHGNGAASSFDVLFRDTLASVSK